jgi:hypothetical protein
MDEVDHLRDGEAVGEHHRFGAAIPAGGEQFERAAAIGLGLAQAAAALIARRWHRAGEPVRLKHFMRYDIARKPGSTSSSGHY